MEHRTIYVLPIPELNNIGHKIANGRRVPSSNIVNAADSTVENDNSKLPFRTRVRNYFKPPYCTKCRRKLQKPTAKTSESLSSTSPSSTKNSWLACCRKQPEPDTEPIVKDSQRPSDVSNGSRREMDSLSSDPNKQRTCCTKFKDLVCCSRKNKVRDLGTEPQGCCGRLKCWKKKQDEENWAERRDSILSDAPPKKCCPISRCWPFCRRGSTETGSTTEPDSRRTSMNDKKKSLTPTTLPPEKKTPVLDESLVEHTSEMRGAIPVLPVPLAWFCLILNCILPGVGTVISGLLCLCFGKPRFSVHDGARLRLGSFIINLIVGVSQLFCVLFCLVGWGWSIWWGVIMLRVSRKYKKMKMNEATMEEDVPSTAPTNQNHNARDVERGRT